MVNKVYIIDDDDISLYLTSLILEQAGFAEEIKTYNSVDTAMQALSAADADALPEIILLDLNMPVHTGWDFLEMLRQQENRLRDRTSIFILTSSIAASDKERSENHPLVRGLVHKPLDEKSMAYIGRVHRASHR